MARESIQGRGDQQGWQRQGNGPHYRNDRTTAPEGRQRGQNDRNQSGGSHGLQRRSEDGSKGKNR